MKGWEEVSLSEVADIIPGYAFKGSDFGKYGVPVVKIKDICPPKINFNNVEYIDSNKYKPNVLNKVRIYKNDFLLAMTGATIGKVGKVYYAGEAYINQRVAKIVPKSFVDWNYIYYQVTSSDFYHHILNNIDSHSAQENISPNSLGRYTFNLPSLNEQCAIASVLSSLDDKIDLLHRQNATLEAMAEALFKKWFVVEAKEEWVETTIGNIFELKGGSTPSTKIMEYWDGNIPWTSPRDLSNNDSVYISNTEKKITEKGLAQISSGILPSGTLLLSSRAPIGYLAITTIDLAINQGYIAILNNKKISNYYMYFWCKHHMTEIESAANGAVFQEISKYVFRELPFVLPPQNVLNDFEKLVKIYFDKLLVNQTQIGTLEKLRDTLLPKLMSGEVRVKY